MAQSNLTKEELKTVSPLALFRHVFGMKPNEKLSEFMNECKSLRDDTAFVAEVREFALANS